MDTDESGSLIKGFCFVEFASAQAANLAVDIFNNCIPEELTNAEHKSYVRVQGTLSQLNVMSKFKWQAFKEEARRIRQEIARLNPSTMFASAGESFEGFKFGTLVRMNHNFDTALLSKKFLTEALSHFGKIAYIDMHNKGKQVTIRFTSKD